MISQGMVSDRINEHDLTAREELDIKRIEESGNKAIHLKQALSHQTQTIT